MQLKNLNISSFPIRIIFVVFTLIGFALAPQLSVQLTPSASKANIQINYNWRGAASKTIESSVTTPLEGALSMIDGIENIHSTSSESRGNIQLRLTKNANLPALRFEIAMAIRRIYTQLPEGVSFPTISVNNPTEREQNQPILTYSLVGRVALTDLYQYAKDELSPQLSLVKDLEHIQVVGGNRLEWQIHYQPSQIRALQLNQQDIQVALQRFFQTDAIGFAHLGTHQIAVNLSPQTIITPSDWQNIPIKKINHRIIYLGDIATVQLSEQPPLSYYRINGKNSVRLLFHAQKTANSITLAEHIKSNIHQISLPPHYQLILDSDTTEYLNEELTKIRNRTLLSLVILLFFVLLVHRSWKHTLVVALSLIVNVGIAAIGYYWFGVEMNLYALAGITVSFGLMIDNTIVMVHHIRHYQNQRVFPALLAASLTTVAALVIVFFLPEKWQLSLVAFSKVIIINLVVSLLVSLLFIPAFMEGLAFRKATKTRVKSILKNKKLKIQFHLLYKNTLLFLIRFRTLIIIFIILLFGLPMWMLPKKIDNFTIYNNAISSDTYTETIAPFLNKWLGGTLRLFSWYVYEGSSYQEPEETVLHVQASMQQGSTLEQMNDVFLKIEDYLQPYEKRINQYVTKINHGEYGSMAIHFKSEHSVHFPYLLRHKLIAYSFNLDGVEWNIYGVGKSFNNSSAGQPVSYQVKMMGYNDDILKEQAQVFAKKLTTHQRIKTVNTEGNMNRWAKDKYAYLAIPNRFELAKRQLNWASFSEVLQDFNQNTTPHFYSPSGQPVRFVANNEFLNDIWRLNNMSLDLKDTKANFSDIVQISKQKISNAIHKENQQYIRMLEWEYTGSAKFGNQYLKKCMEEMNLEMPLGYSMEWQTYEWGKEERQQYGLLLLVIGLIFFISAVLFESIRQGLTVILLIPTSFIGIFLTFYGFDFQFDQGGYTSFILTSGLVVNSLILIINDYNGLRRKFPKRNSLDLYLKAFYHKITPILLTIFSTALGLLPFVIGGQQEVFWFSLAVGTIGGLVFSLVIILFFIPLFFVDKP